MSFKPTRLFVETPNGAQFLLVTETGLLDRGFKHSDRLVIDFERDREGVPVLAAMSEGETGRIGKTAWRAMDNFRDHRQRADGPSADPGHLKQLSEVPGAGVGRGGEAGVEPAKDDIPGSDVMTARKDEMGKEGLSLWLWRSKLRGLRDKPVGTEIGEKLQLSRA